MLRDRLFDEASRVTKMVEDSRGRSPTQYSDKDGGRLQRQVTYYKEDYKLSFHILDAML